MIAREGAITSRLIEYGSGCIKRWITTSGPTIKVNRTTAPAIGTNTRPAAEGRWWRRRAMRIGTTNSSTVQIIVPEREALAITEAYSEAAMAEYSHKDSGVRSA